MAYQQPVSAFDQAVLEAAAACPGGHNNNNNNNSGRAQVSEGCGDSSSDVPSATAAALPPAAAAVPPGVDLGAGAVPMDRDALARMWGAQFDALELDGEWLDRLDMGFDLSDFAAQPQQQQQQQAAAAAQQRGAGAGAGPSSEAADGLVPSMGNDLPAGAFDATAFDADVAAYAALDDFSGGAGAGAGAGLAVPSLGALVHPALPQQQHYHQPYGGFPASGDDLKKPAQQQVQQQQQPQYGAAPTAFYPQQHQQQQQQQQLQQPPQQQQYAAAPTQYAPPQYMMQQPQPQYQQYQQYQQQQQQQQPLTLARKPANKAAAPRSGAARPSAAAAAPSAAPLSPADANAALSRSDRVARFRLKRLRRSFKKTIRYESRRAYAEVRPRIKGRFATKDEVAAYRAAEAALREGRQDVVLPPFFAELAGAMGGAQAQAAC